MKILATVSLSLFLFVAATPAVADDGIDYSEDIAPVLDKHCVRCHGPRKQRGGFRVDIRTSAVGEADSGEKPIVPGDVRASELIQRIESTDDGVWMPPDGPRLTRSEIGKPKRWIQTGAKWGEAKRGAVSTPQEMVVTDEDRQFWLFRPLSKVRPPSIEDEWVRNDIDQFILLRLREHRLRPSPAASHAKLIRRVSFDLTGLPPGEIEVVRFPGDTTPADEEQRYDRLIERLLGNPHFGERWARHWLDVARYADSDGYEADKDRPHAFPNRDFVIRAFNDDLPFDGFVRWQIAGDELEPDNPRAVAATGFLTAGPVTNGGAPTVPEIVKRKARYDELDDMASTTVQAFLGLTLACARCHDHKFDPIPTRDYYRLVSAFATTERRVSELDRAKRDLDIWVKRSKRRLLLEKIARLNCTSDEAKWLAAGPLPPAESKAAFRKVWEADRVF